MLASPAPPSVSVSVSFSAVRGRSHGTEARSRSGDRPPMNAGERACTQPCEAPPQLESVLEERALWFLAHFYSLVPMGAEHRPDPRCQYLPIAWRIYASTPLATTSSGGSTWYPQIVVLLLADGVSRVLY